MQLTLGHTGITTSALALGCARIGSALTPLGRRECVALIEEAFALGVRHFDTASIYGQGDSERYIGEALGRRRGQVCLSSKAGQRLTAKQALMSGFKTPIRWMAARRSDLRQSVAGQRAQGVPRCFEPDYIEQSLHASLQRLRTDHLDIFYLHSPDASVLADEALLERIEKMREQGLFRAFGVSCDDDHVAWKAAAHDAVQVVQFAFEDTPHGHALLRELARHGRLAVLRGFMQAHTRERLHDEALSQRFGQTLKLPALGGLIVGTTRIQHLRDNVAAFERALLTRSAP
jgi:aryl-alcohol dehydrogenase-like predicted oxidoreductase